MDALLARVIDEADAGQLPVLIDDWIAAGDARHWIARALRIDLAVLVERPELVVPCLLRRCAWFGAEYPAFVRRSEPPPDAAAVRGLARSWAASWRRPYLRSLRTPRLPLDSGVIEEYRSGATGPLWLTASHVGLGNDVAWDRASGRRAAMAMPAVRESTWRFARERRELVSDAQVWPLPIERGHDPLEVFVLDDDLAVVTAQFDEGYGEAYENFTYLIDLRRGERLATWPVFCAAAARHGDTIYATDGDMLYAWSLIGDPPRGGDIAGAGLVMAADGTFATRTKQVVRVFDPERVGLASVDDRYTAGLVALSPDGTRAITGQVLCDATSGEQLAEVQFSGIGNWLEGGPSRNCRALCDDVVIEILPFGYHLWDSTTGEILVDDRNHRSGTRDAVAFAPNGRTHAILNRGTLRVYDNHSLRVLSEQPLAVGDVWRLVLAFSYDGSTLWIGEGDAEPVAMQVGPGRPTRVPLRAAAITNGLVTLGKLVLPIDDFEAQLSAGGNVVLGWSTHYVVG